MLLPRRGNDPAEADAAAANKGFSANKSSPSHRNRDQYLGLAVMGAVFWTVTWFQCLRPISGYIKAKTAIDKSSPTHVCIARYAKRAAMYPLSFFLWPLWCCRCCYAARRRNLETAKAVEESKTDEEPGGPRVTVPARVRYLFPQRNQKNKIVRLGHELETVERQAATTPESVHSLSSAETLTEAHEVVTVQTASPPTPFVNVF